MIMQVARDLSSQLRRMREVSEGSSVDEEFPLDFGRKSAPSHHNGRTQTVQNMLFFGERLIHPLGAPRFRPFFVWSGGMAARITLRVFSRGHVRDMGLMTAAYQESVGGMPENCECNRVSARRNATAANNCTAPRKMKSIHANRSEGAALLNQGSSRRGRQRIAVLDEFGYG